MVWRAVCFVLFFLDLVLSPFGTFKILDAIFEQKLSTNFTQKELRWKKEALKLFSQFLTFKQHWNIYVGDPQGNITQFGHNPSTTVDSQAEKQPEWWWEKFFNLAETKYKQNSAKYPNQTLGIWFIVRIQPKTKISLLVGHFVLENNFLLCILCIAKCSSDSFSNFWCQLLPENGLNIPPSR